MKNADYIFLKKRYAEGDDYIFAISPERIETLDLHSTYSQHGQIVGHTDAGDYHIENGYCEAKSALQSALKEQFGKDIEVDDDGQIASIDGVEVDSQDSEIMSFIKNWRKENETRETIKGFTFWNGHNWQTIVVDAGHYESEYIVVDDGSGELIKAIMDKQFITEGFGEKTYSGNGYVVIESYFESAWENFRLIPESEYAN